MSTIIRAIFQPFFHLFFEKMDDGKILVQVI